MAESLETLLQSKPYLSSLLQAKSSEAPFAAADEHKPYIEARNEYALDQNALLAVDLMKHDGLFADLSPEKQIDAVKHLIYVGYELKQLFIFEQYETELLSKLIDTFKELKIFSEKADDSRLRMFTKALINFAVRAGGGDQPQIKKIPEKKSPELKKANSTIASTQSAEKLVTQKLASFFTENKT